MNTPALDDLEQAYEQDFNEESGSEFENSFILEDENDSGMLPESLERSKLLRLPSTELSRSPSDAMTASPARSKPIAIVPDSTKHATNHKLSGSFEQPKPSSDIDKLTLELLINKTQYNKYLSKTDPHKYKEHQDHLSKICKYKGRIMAMTSELLDDPNCQINGEINEQMDIFVRCCIRYLEIQDRWNSEKSFYKSNEDEDVLFPNNDMDETHVEHELTPKQKPKASQELFGHGSFWGKTITKQQQTIHDSSLFSGKRRSEL